MKKNKFPFRYISSNSDRLSVRFEKDNLKEVVAKQSGSFRMEIIKEGKLGSAAMNQPDRDELLSRAIRSSEFGDIADYKFPKESKAAQVNLYSKEVEKISPDELIKLGQFLISSLKEEEKEALIDVSLTRSIGKMHLEHSEGFSCDQKETLFAVSLEGELVKEGDILSIGDFWAWGDKTFRKEEFVGFLKEKFKLARKISKVSSGKMPVIFTPDAISVLLGPVETALSAKSVYKKVSRWEGKMESQVTDSRFTLFDNPLINFATGSTAYDEEGFSLKPLNLIEKGKVKNFYTDLKTARKLGITPNGRGFGIPASPSLTNLEILPGAKKKEEIISKIKKGILVGQVIGGGQDSPYSGDFSLNIHLGFLVENGKIIGRVKNCLVSGNVFEMLRDQISEISSDREWVGGSFYLPHILFHGINVVGQ